MSRLSYSSRVPLIPGAGFAPSQAATGGLESPSRCWPESSEKREEGIGPLILNIGVSPMSAPVRSEYMEISYKDAGKLNKLRSMREEFGQVVAKKLTSEVLAGDTLEQLVFTSDEMKKRVALALDEEDPIDVAIYAMFWWHTIL